MAFLALASFGLLTTALAQGNAPPVVSTSSVTGTTTAGASQMTASSQLKLAKTYTADTFYNEWDYFTDNDPTGGYVNYVSRSDAASLGLIATIQDGSFVMRADAENKASGRGRNSVRISSKSKWADGVYILDMNHMPVGCGTWPAFWTVVKDGWPTGGEIDIIEGSNAYPQLNSASYNATSSAGFKNRTAGYPVEANVASLHTQDNCVLAAGSYMTGSLGSTTCSAYLNGNQGCGAQLAGPALYGTNSFGAGVNEAGGGWYALWRDLEGSGGVYTYFWPRNATNVPDDVRYPNTTATNVANWGEPGTNLSVPTCRKEFHNHVIVFNIAMCGDYAQATYGYSGCPQTCTSFTQNNPEAFGEAYWSINSLRVYTKSGSAAANSSSLSKGAIAGIVVGAVVVLVIAGLLFWRYRSRKAKRIAAARSQADWFADDEPLPPKHTGWAGLDDTRPDSSSRDALTAPSLDSQPLGVSSANSTPTKKQKKVKEPKIRAFASAHPKPKASSSSLQTSSLLDSAAGSGAATPTAEDTSPEGSIIGGSMTPRTKKKRSGPNLIVTNKPRTGRTQLAPGKTARHYLDGETPSGAYHLEADGVPLEPRKAPNSWVG